MTSPTEVTIVTAAPALSETPARTRSGIPALVVVAVLAVAAVGALVGAIAAAATAAPTAVGGSLVAATVALGILAIVLASGLYMLQPNQSAVLTFFGAYRGTDRTPGLRFANPLYAVQHLSLRVRNFTTPVSKVNDANGNPIDIAAVIVWQVTDTAKAAFGVDDLAHYVETQSESAVRQLARSYPYDAFEDGHRTTLIGATEEVNNHLQHELQERADEAGVAVLETRITDLSYAPEIAEVMLRRQQAAAIVAARKKIVEGAVLMVREAIDGLEQGDDTGEAIPLDSERKATFAANLMTVIASDQPTNPVVNVGTLNR